jgi:CRISPR-associated protein Cas2
MGMTVVVTRNVPMRFRGFLASCMLEVSAGVYTHPRMSKAIRERVWSVLEDWFSRTIEASVIMIYADGANDAGQSVKTLGEPPRKVVDVDGVILSRLL